MIERSDAQKSKSHRRQWHVAQKIEDNAKLICALSFYIKRLKPEEETEVSTLQSFYRCLPKRWRQYLKGARHWLGIKYVKRTTLKLPIDYWWRLLCLGRNLWQLDEVEQRKFKALNADLVVDDAVIAFSEAHPEIIERYRIFLEQNYPLAERLKERAKQEEQAKAAERAKQQASQFWVDYEEGDAEPQPAFNLSELMKGNIKKHLKQKEIMMPWDQRLSQPHR